MIENIFPTKIYKTSYSGSIQQLKKDLLPKFASVFDDVAKNNQGSIRGQGMCSYNVFRQMQHWPEVKLFLDFLQPHLILYWKELGFDETITPKINEMWANKYEKDSFIDLHNHSPVNITVSFYLSKPKDSGNIVFEHPLETLLKHQPIALDNVNNYHNWFQKEVEVNEGDVVMFPGWLRHKTTPSNSSQSRIILGANIYNSMNR